jgi:hypothetical protein
LDDPKLKNIYSFVDEREKKHIKILTIISFVVIGLIGVLFTLEFISGFNNNSTSKIVNTVSEEQTEANRILDERANLTKQYRDAGIPYDDPQGRFIIDFGTPVPSSTIVVSILVDDPQGLIRKEAEEILNKASTYVKISDITYLERND